MRHLYARGMRLLGLGAELAKLVHERGESLAHGHVKLPALALLDRANPHAGIAHGHGLALARLVIHDQALVPLDQALRAPVVVDLVAHACARLIALHAQWRERVNALREVGDGGLACFGDVVVESFHGCTPKCGVMSRTGRDGGATPNDAASTQPTRGGAHTRHARPHPERAHAYT